MSKSLEQLLLSIASFERAHFFRLWNQAARSEEGLSWKEKLEFVLEHGDFSDRSIGLPPSVSFVSILSPDYPVFLRELPQPPLGLFVMGQLGDTALLAVIGSRKPSPYSLRMTRACVNDAVSKGYSIVSGGAYGVDIEAHRSALDCGGKTWVVLGSGFQHLYPKKHEMVFNEVLRAGGALISEYPPFLEPQARFFPERNRLIAALSDRLLLVQAHLRSGSMSTARAALDLGKEVEVIRPPLGDENFAGSAALIDAGARAISGPQDLYSR